MSSSCSPLPTTTTTTHREAGEGLQQRIRIATLYVILGICAATVIGSLATGKAPPEAVYGLLGTFGAYVLFGPDTAHHIPTLPHKPPAPGAAPPDPPPAPTNTDDGTSQ